MDVVWLKHQSKDNMEESRDFVAEGKLYLDTYVGDDGKKEAYFVFESASFLLELTLSMETGFWKEEDGVGVLLDKYMDHSQPPKSRRKGRKPKVNPK